MQYMNKKQTKNLVYNIRDFVSVNCILISVNKYFLYSNKFQFHKVEIIQFQKKSTGLIKYNLVCYFVLII